MNLSEAVFLILRMYCDITEVLLQEGSVSCAINHVVCTITKCITTEADQTGKILKWEWNLSLYAVWFRIYNETWLVRINIFLFCFYFLSDFMNNVTWSYAYFVLLKLLWYTSTVQHKETKCWCFDSEEKEVFCLAVSGINCMFKHWNFFLEVRSFFFSFPKIFYCWHWRRNVIHNLH